MRTDTEIRHKLTQDKGMNSSEDLGFCLVCFKMGEIIPYFMLDVDGNDLVEKEKLMTKREMGDSWRDIYLSREGSIGSDAEKVLGRSMISSPVAAWKAEPMDTDGGKGINAVNGLRGWWDFSFDCLYFVDEIGSKVIR